LGQTAFVGYPPSDYAAERQQSPDISQFKRRHLVGYVFRPFRRRRLAAILSREVTKKIGIKSTTELSWTRSLVPGSGITDADIPRVSDRRSVKPSASLADTWLSRTKIFLEIVAIPVVAYWASRASTLRKRQHWSIVPKFRELSWQRRSDKECIAEYGSKFENIGMSSMN